MKRVFVVTIGFLLLSGMALIASAQTRPGTATPTQAATPQPTPAATAPAAAVPATKIALVDTTMFGDEKLGIKRYVNAMKSLQAEFQVRETDLSGLQNQIKLLADEITKLRANPVVGPETIRAKQAEGERLQRDFTYKKGQYDSDLEKRYAEVVTPVSGAIGKALDQFAVQRGLTMVLDISKLLPAVLSMSPSTDITQSFIADYNSKNP